MITLRHWASFSASLYTSFLRFTIWQPFLTDKGTESRSHSYEVTQLQKEDLNLGSLTLNTYGLPDYWHHTVMTAVPEESRGSDHVARAEAIHLRIWGMDLRVSFPAPRLRSSWLLTSNSHSTAKFSPSFGHWPKTGIYFLYTAGPWSKTRGSISFRIDSRRC